MKGNLALSLESVEVRMGQLAKDEITFQKNFTFEDIIDSINRVTLDDFRRICDRIFGTEKLSVVSVGRLAGPEDPGVLHPALMTACRNAREGKIFEHGAFFCFTLYGIPLKNR